MRLQWWGTLATAVILANASAVRAQTYQQRSNAAPAPQPDFRRILVKSHAATPAANDPKPANGPQQGPVNNDSHRHHHNASQTNWNGGPIGFAPWVFWGGGYPILWSGVAPGGGFFNPAFAVPPLPAGPAVIDPPRPTDDDAKQEIKPTNADTKARAGKFIGYGDALFAKQNYLAAAARYRTAAGVAADMPEPSMRQGFALVALGNYASAAKAFRRGLSIRPDWSDSPFRLRDLYGADVLAKTGHLEALAAAVEANAFDAEPIVVLAIELYFDGQRDRSELFFARAAQLGANDDRLLNAFLGRPNAAAKQPAPAPAPPGAVQNNKGPAKVVF